MGQAMFEVAEPNVSSTQRLARLLIYFAVFFFDTIPQCVGAKIHRSKFLQGTLFYLGGMLKIEARNYMLTK